MTPEVGSVYKNNKTGNYYTIAGIRFDATNDTEGRILVDYDPIDISTCTKEITAHLYEVKCHGYSRELNEFMSKFTYSNIRLDE